MKKELTEELKKKMEVEKETIERDLASFATKDQKPTGDWDTAYPKFNGSNLEEEADEVEEYETLLQIEHKLETKLADLSSALEKIKNGKYGICEKCGKEIEEERLKIIPETRFCLKCQ